MEKNFILSKIRQIVDTEWANTNRPVLLSALPPILEREVGKDYKPAIADKSLKTFILENSENSGIRIVQDPEHHARIGVVPFDQEYSYPSTNSPVLHISATDAQAFARVLNTLNTDEQKSLLLPASLVARLITAR